MKEIESIKKVKLTFNELITNVHTLNSNRCGDITKEDAVAKGFTEEEYNTFVRRANKLKKIILKKGFSKASFFILAKDENGEIYLIDGQGRRMALYLISKEKDLSTMEFVCDLYTEPMSFEEMTKLVIDLNSGNTNWNNKDIRRSNALASNDESVIEAYNYAKKLSEDYSIGDYVANLLTYGEKASHSRSTGNNSLSTKDYSETKDLFTNAYIKFLVETSTKYDSNGNLVERTKKAQKAIRNTNLAIAIVGCFRDIVKSHNCDIEESKEDIDYFTNTLIGICDGSDEYIIQQLKCPTSKKEEGWNKIKSRIRKASVVNAYKNSCAYAY